jgi:hypothetical protein
MTYAGSGQREHGEQNAGVSAFVRNVRRSERVLLVVPIRISGEAGDGQKFSEDGQTLDVSRYGATISVGRRLQTTQNITIMRIAPSNQAVARVTREISGLPRSVYGVEFLDQAVNLWDITFPPIADSEKAVLRILLRCLACQRLEVAYLDEFEAEIFLVQHNLPRLCSRCGGLTTWTQPYGQMSDAGEVFNTSRLVRGSDVGERRSRARVRIETVACIRHPDADLDEVVVAADIARGGLSFFSPTKYAQGLLIEVAMPYSSRVPNIFAPARITHYRIVDGRNFAYGVSFIGG